MTITELQQFIEAPIALEARSKRDAILSVQRQRELTKEEQETLSSLIDTVKIANAARWQTVAELAQRHGLSLREVAHLQEIEEG